MQKRGLLINFTKRFIVQRKLDLTWKNPYELAEKYKQAVASVPRLEDENVPVHKPIELYNAVAEKNIKILEENKKKGKIIGSEIVAEEPAIQEWMDWVKKERSTAQFDPETSKRTGVIAVKVGMVNAYDSYYTRMPITILQVQNCQVVQTKTQEKEGYDAIQVGAGLVKLKRVTKPLMGHFAKAGVEPKHVLHEFRVSRDCMLPVGYEISARHFLPGQYLDITGISTGKGFQGAMKRWNFSGLPASHGVSVVHRSLGSTGSTDHVFKGKKMHGNMGNQQVTLFNNYLFGIDVKLNCLLIKGSVPGKRGSYVIVKDAFRKPYKDYAQLPYPSFQIPENEDLSAIDDKQSIIKHKGQRRPLEWVGLEMDDNAIMAKLKQIAEEEE